MPVHLKKYLVLLFPALLYVQGCVALTETTELRQLREDYRTLQQLQTEFSDTAQSGGLSTRDAADFKIWIGQLQTRLAEDCLAVSVKTKSLPADPPCEVLIDRYAPPADINTQAESTEAEKTARMIEQLNGSFGEFDERLLTEQERVKSRKPKTDASGGSGADGGGDGGAEGSGGSNTQKGENGEETDSRTQTAGADEQNRGLPGNEKGVSAKQTSEQKSSVPKDIPDGRNDDVIARQLREAAEKETDPELKKKLWDEYRRYKTGSR